MDNDCGQLRSTPQTKEVLYIHGLSFGAKSDPNGEVKIYPNLDLNTPNAPTPPNIGMNGVNYTFLCVNYPTDTDIWKKLISGEITVNEADRSLDIPGTLSQWWLTPNERITVFNPAMRYSPLKLVRTNENIDIQMWAEFRGDVAKTIAVVDQRSSMVPGTPKTLRELAIEGFEQWGRDGKQKVRSYKKNIQSIGTVDSFGMCDEVYVTMKVHENATGKQQSIPITLFDRFPNTAIKEGSHVYYSKYWRVFRVGDYMELYTGTPLALIDMRNPNTPLQNKPLIRHTISFDQRLFIYTASHEMGHLLGLWEAYGYSNQTPPGLTLEKPVTNEVTKYDIMRGFQGDGLFWGQVDLSDREYTSNDMEMILEAWKMNINQFFYEYPPKNKRPPKTPPDFLPSSVILI